MKITWECAEQIYHKAMDAAQDIPGGGIDAEQEAIAVLKHEIEALCTQKIRAVHEAMKGDY